ncbi:hypothetical protein pdam_00003678, partial [Pocillopora damicornis]
IHICLPIVDLFGYFQSLDSCTKVVLSIMCAVSVAGSTFGLWVALAWLTLPICILKQSISVIQLTVACINTASLDESERERVNK